MDTQSYLISFHKQNYQVKPISMVSYRQSKIVECLSNEDEKFYLFFYKRYFLTGVKATTIQPGSYIERAFKEGIIFTGSHPLTYSLLNEHPTYKCIRFNQLLKKVQLHFSPQETALIFTYFDSFIQEDKIKKLLKNTFYQFRRDGKDLHAFKLIKIYIDFSPSDSFGKDMASHLNFRKYESLYKDRDILKQKDPLFAEIFFFDNRQNQKCFDLLTNIYQEQKRWMDELILYVDALTKKPNETTYQTYKELLKEHFNPQQAFVFSNDIATYSPPLKTLYKDLLTEAIKLENHNEIVQVFMEHELEITQHQKEKIKESFLKITDTSLSLDVIIPKLISLFDDDHQTLEKIIKSFVSKRMKDTELTKIAEWLKPLRNHNIHLPIEQKFNKMIKLTEDPDHQYELGELYSYFYQYEQAENCFKWEMELNPNNPEPVQSLLKIYQTLGKKDEINTYKQLLIHMKKTS